VPEKKDVMVACPCCDSRIEIDLRTGKVLRWRRPEELDETGKPVVTEGDWADANKRVSNRLGEAKDRFESGLSKEKSRVNDLDDLFKKASDKLRKREDERPDL